MLKSWSKWMFAAILATGAVRAVGETFELAAKASAPQPKLQIDTIDGTAFDLFTLRGQWVVVNFWATWCPPCIKEMPELSALDAERKDVAVVGLAFEEIDVEELKAFVKQHPVVYPIALVDVYNPPADFDTPRGLPLTYLIAPDGSVAEKIMGPVTRAELEKMIAAKQP
jgi:thiol-disulfide isomerase/thioredoxin